MRGVGQTPTDDGDVNFNPEQEWSFFEVVGDGLWVCMCMESGLRRVALLVLVGYFCKSEFL